MRRWGMKSEELGMRNGNLFIFLSEVKNVIKKVIENIVMKRVLLILGVVLTMSCAVMAQDKSDAKCDMHKNRAEWFAQMRTKKLVFLVNEMGLTDTEEATFAVLFEKHEIELGECYKKIRTAKRSLNDESTEENYKKVVEIVRIETLKIAEMRADYLAKLEKILPAQKIYKLYAAEEAYKKLLISDMGKCKRNDKK